MQVTRGHAISEPRVCYWMACAVYMYIYLHIALYQELYAHAILSEKRRRSRLEKCESEQERKLYSWGKEKGGAYSGAQQRRASRALFRGASSEGNQQCKRKDGRTSRFGSGVSNTLHTPPSPPSLHRDINNRKKQQRREHHKFKRQFNINDSD